MEQPEDLYRLATRLPMRTPPITSSGLTHLKQQMDVHFRNSLVTDSGVRAFAAIAAERLEDPDLPAKAEEVISAGDESVQARLAFLSDSISLLNIKIDQPFMEDVFARICLDLNETAATNFGKLIATVRSEPGTKGIVVMVAGTCYNVIWREAWALRRRGFRVFLVCLDTIPDDQIASYSEAFDRIFHGCDNYVALDLVLRHLEPDVFHVQCRMWEYVMGRFVLERKRKARVICEFYDITGIVSTREAYYTNWLPAAVDLELDCERTIIRESDGIVHRFPTELITEHCETYGRVPPQAEIQQYPIAPLLQSRPSTSRGPNEIRCVYIGGIVPRNERHPPALYPNWGAAEAWEVLLRAGISVSIYYTPYGKGDIPGFKFLEDLQERYPHFEVKPSLPTNELAAGIAGYDFGLIINNLDMTNSMCRPELYKGGVGTKFFNYLEAGLPILINSEYKHASSIIQNNGIGLTASSEELQSLPERLRKVDYAQMRNNVSQFITQNLMEHKISSLIDLYGLSD